MLRILLVDDNEMNLDMLSRRLQRKGYEVISACGGYAALTAVDQRQPDMILLDLSLPDLSGWEIARRLKTAQTTAGIPILALSALTSETDRRRALEAGCDDYDTKPIDLPRLLAKMESLSHAHLYPGVS